MCWQIKNNTLYYSMLSFKGCLFLIICIFKHWLNAKTNFIVTFKSCELEQKSCVTNTKTLCDKHKNPLCIAHKKVVHST